jgi:hypothetical protein
MPGRAFIPFGASASGQKCYRFASTQALQTAIGLPLGSGSARVHPSAESVKTSFGCNVSKPPTRVALIHTALPLWGSAEQFAFEQVQLSIGMVSVPFARRSNGRNRTSPAVALFVPISVSTQREDRPPLYTATNR